MNALITTSLATGDVHLLFGFPQNLMSKTERKVVTWIQEYTSLYGKPPTHGRLSEEFDTYVAVLTGDPLGDIYDRTLKRKRNIFTREYMTEIQDELKRGADPLPYIQSLLAEISGGRGDVTRYSVFDRSAYLRRPTSTPYGIDALDQKTGGVAAGDLIYLIGRLGTGKTTFSLWVLTKWLLQGKKILMVSNENRADDVVAKIDAYLGGFNPINKRTMKWSDDDVNRLNTVSYIAKNMEGEVFIPNRPVQDVKEVQGLITSYRPDLVMIDGIYLMTGADGDSHWEKITNISRSLKKLADGEGLPLMGIHQASRNAVGKRIEIEHIAYADALAQDADLVLGLNAEDDGDIFIEAIKSRWGETGWGFFVKFYFETMSVKVMDARYAVETEE